LLHCRMFWSIFEGGNEREMFRELELGAIRAHILHHAAKEPVYGSWLIEELARHGYSLSYGTLYPTLHRMEEEGFLEREERVHDGRVRKYYTATEAGRVRLEELRKLITALYIEVVEEKEPLT